MNGFKSILAPALIAALSFGFAVSSATAPAAAAIRPDCASDSNLMHVHRRLDGAIDQLNHDDRDYGGHRVAAMNDLQNARNELVAAERYSQSTDPGNPACLATRGGTGGSDINWGLRGQRGSNANIWSVRKWVDRMIGELNHDERDYGGHRVAAINDMQQARAQLAAAEKFR